MADQKAELDARITSAQEILEEYAAKVNQHLLTDAEIHDRMIKIRKFSNVISDIGSPTFPNAGSRSRAATTE